MKRIYVVQVTFPDMTSSVSTTGYDKLEDAQEFVKDRCGKLNKGDWSGTAEHDGKFTNFSIREILIYDEERLCPKCKKYFTSYPAISRKDNKTEICPECGVREAIEQCTKAQKRGII